MNERKPLYFELLGTFSYALPEEKGGTPPKAGKKVLSFLQYLIVNHGRSISSEELIGKFWAEKSSDPANALRHMVFKVRLLLRTMFPEQEDLLQTLPGCYVWNADIPLELDTERFETACLEARKIQGQEHVRLLLLAVSLYKGDFLSANDSEWALVLRQYYRALYLDMCREVLPLLAREEKWIEVLNICGQGYQIDFAEEDFIIYQMRALIALGQPEQAIEKYEAFRDKMHREFGISPANRVERLYVLAVGLCQKGMESTEVLKRMCEGELDRRAFFCTFEIFQNIVALERRHLERTEQTSTLAIVSLGKGAVPVTDMRRLERILLESLRTGDPVARLETGAYILMLTGADEENTRLVMSRIDRAFHMAYRHSKADITYRIAALPSGKKYSSDIPL